MLSCSSPHTCPFSSTVLPKQGLLHCHLAARPLTSHGKAGSSDTLPFLQLSSDHLPVCHHPCQSRGHHPWLEDPVANWLELSTAAHGNGLCVKLDSRTVKGVKLMSSNCLLGKTQSCIALAQPARGPELAGRHLGACE